MWHKYYVFKIYQILHCYMPSPRTQNVRHSCSVVSGSQIGGVKHAGYTPVRGIYCLSRNCWFIHPSAGYTPEQAIHQKIRYSQSDIFSITEHLITELYLHNNHRSYICYYTLKNQHTFTSNVSSTTIGVLNLFYSPNKSLLL